MPVPSSGAITSFLSKYDADSRTGVVWSINQNLGGTTSAANVRQVQFGFDAGTQPAWTDCGRPGEAVLIYALAVHDGSLFAGTCEAGKESSGHVFRYDGPRQWMDCGVVDRCNAVSTLAESPPFERARYNLNNRRALKIGFGPHDYFHGSLSDLRIYSRALAPPEISELARP